MSIVRWDPFKELEDMNHRLNRVFARNSHLGKDREAMTFPDWQPSVDIHETAEAYEIQAELPSVKKEDIKVNVENGVLYLRGERKLEKETKEKKVHRVERSYGSFVRSFALPDDVDESAIKADYKDGLLNVQLMKSTKAKPRTVEVKVG